MTKSLPAIILVLLTLTACDSVRQELGLGRNPPDEFSVVDRAPLSMPPDYNLRPPQPGAPRPQEADVTVNASEVLLGKPVRKTVATTSEGEKSFLASLGADKAEPDIRQKIDREASGRVGASKHLIQELLWWKRDNTPGTTVNASAEAARIKDAKDKGEPIAKGATPVIERQKSGWLGL